MATAVRWREVLAVHHLVPLLRPLPLILLFLLSQKLLALLVRLLPALLVLLPLLKVALLPLVTALQLVCPQPQPLRSFAQQLRPPVAQLLRPLPPLASP